MSLWENLSSAQLVDLAHPWERGMPVSPNHPPYQMALIRRHGDMTRADGSSAANELIVMGGHVGTHVDALCHVSHQGRLHGGVEAGSVQSQVGFSRLGADEIRPFLGRGVLLDVAAARDEDVLEPGYKISVDDLEQAEKLAGVAVGEGDAVLVRSGWSRHWNNAEVFLGQVDGAPGPGEEAAAWLADRRIGVTGAETVAYEAIRPGAGHALLPVHRLLLVESGIHIIEAMNLEGLAATGIYEFGFVGVPLNLRGATGSPLRPLALIDA